LEQRLDETTIFVTIIPYNTAGNAIGCTEESFTTETIIPLCTNLTAPLDGATNVAITTDLNWTAIANADGYILTVGTTTGGTDIVNTQDLGNVATYNFPADLPDETIIFVSITPYNTAGNAIGCIEESFTTETIIPLCTNLIVPLDGATDVDISTDIYWAPVYNADGYFITIGTTPNGIDIENNLDVGNTTNYDFINDLPESTIIYITITPYNTAGSALTCIEEQFTTEDINVEAPRFFTPNADGYHDTWKVLDRLNEVKLISIFDRYGKLLKQLSTSSNGWDGTYNGKLLPSSSYWYLIEKHDGKVIRGSFSLIR